VKATVTVMLKAGVLDPQGKAIGQALHNLGFSGVGEVRAGKVIELELAETDAERQSAIESHETYLRETARYPLTPEVAAESERIRQLFLAEEKEWRASLPPDPESGNGSAVLETVEVTDLSQIHPGRKWDGKIRHAGDINLR